MANETNTLEDIEKKLNELTEKVNSLEAENTKLKLEQSPAMAAWKKTVRMQSIGLRGIKKRLEEENPGKEITFAPTGSISIDDLKRLF